MRFDPRLVIIGEAPGRQDSGTTPLFGTSANRAGSRLREMARCTRSEWLRVRRVNLFAVLPERWDRTAARTTAQAWCHALLRDHHCVLLGRRVAAAFGCADLVPMTWGECPWAIPLASRAGPVYCACIPHPSGRCLAYNDAAFRADVGAFLRASIRGDYA